MAIIPITSTSYINRTSFEVLHRKLAVVARICQLIGEINRISSKARLATTTPIMQEIVISQKLLLLSISMLALYGGMIA